HCYQKSHPYGVGRAKISGSYLLMLKKDEDDVALPYLMAPHIILTPACRPPLSLERRGDGGED
ncbi:MAG: hypothetical protein WHT29_08495, partial [Bacteroidales bacterium]